MNFIAKLWTCEYEEVVGGTIRSMTSAWRFVTGTMPPAMPIIWTKPSIGTGKHYPSALQVTLGVALRDLFDETGSQQDLHEAAEKHQEVLLLCPSGHSRRHHALYNLGVTLHVLHKNCSVIGVDVLSEAILCFRETVILRPHGNPRRHYALYGLGGVLHDRYLANNDVAALEEAIECYREALSLRPKGHRWRAEVVDDLAAALRLRFTQLRELSLLKEADQLEHESFQLHQESPNLKSKVGHIPTRH